MSDLPIQSFKLSEQGLTHIFGELEAKLGEAVWELEQASVQDVIEHLGGDLNYKTTMTVLTGLVLLSTQPVIQHQEVGACLIEGPPNPLQTQLTTLPDW